MDDGDDATANAALYGSFSELVLLASVPQILVFVMCLLFLVLGR